MRPTRREKKTWRQRLSRARNTRHPLRAPIGLRDGTVIGVWDPLDVTDETGENDYPARMIRAPWKCRHA